MTISNIFFGELSHLPSFINSGINSQIMMMNYVKLGTVDATQTQEFFESRKTEIKH